jgi:hypothetical protein
MKIAVVYLGWCAFPAMVTVHEDDNEANAAVSAHAKANGLSIINRSPIGFGGRYQLTTHPGRESPCSYLILPVGEEDTEEHGFATPAKYE